ncbi:MAG: LytTR family transcriptional regulator [Oceanospirillaceae bacterium]|nr:LytTR family transcriptional regulator [Oceanospirillaceae bacterium]
MPILFFTLIVVLITASNFTLFLTLNHSEKSTLLQSPIQSNIVALVESQTFKDNAYNFNIKSLQMQLEYHVKHHHHLSPIPLCIRLKIKSFSSQQYQLLEACTTKTTQASILNNTKKTTANSIKINILNKELGEISWLYTKSESESVYWIVFVSIIEIFLLLLLLRLYLLKVAASKVTEVAPIAELTPLISAEFSNLQLKIKSHLKILADNKRFYPLTPDSLFVFYQHPYALIYDIKGREHRIRATLSCIEKADFSDAFIRVSRTHLININNIQQYAKFAHSSGNEKNVLSIVTDHKKVDIKVSQSLADPLIHMYQGNKVSKSRLETAE